MSIDSRISLHKLDVFALVVELGGVTNAADRLMVAPSVVTAHLRSLEERLGVKLFYREGRGLALTEGGRSVHAWVTDLQRRTRELARDIEGLSGGQHGTVVVGASMSLGTYVLPSVLLAFRRERPLVSIRLDMPEATHALEDTDSGHNDFSVVVLTEPITSRALTSEHIGDEDLVVLAPAQGLIDGDTVTVDELGRLPFVEAPANLGRRRFVDRSLEGWGIRDRHVAFEFGHPEAIKQAVVAGAGVAVLFRSAVQRELRDGSAREIAVDDLRLSGPVHVVWRKDKLLSPVHHDLIARVRAHFA